MVIAPDGFPLWVSDAGPGSVHDITAARIHALPARYWAAAAGLPTLAYPGYDGAGIGVHIPVKQPTGGREPDIGTRTRNTVLRSRARTGQYVPSHTLPNGDVSTPADQLHYAII